VVDESIEGFILSNPHVQRLPDHRVLVGAIVIGTLGAVCSPNGACSIGGTLPSTKTSM
jgi:hypothetical protein